MKDGHNLHSNPFEFTLPPGINSANDQASPPCRQFPPSFRGQKSAHWDMKATDVCVAYFIQAEVSYELLTKAGWEKRELRLARPVECIPYINVQPPIETTCFATEYVLRTEHPVWSSIFGRKVGTVVIETQEPPPLEYTSDHASTSSMISLKFQVAGNDTHQLRIKSVEIHPVLCMKQFRSRDKLKGIPRVDQATDDEALSLSQDVVDLEKYIVSEFQWIKERKRDGDSPPTYQRASVSDEGPKAACKGTADQAVACRSQAERPSPPGVEDSGETWTTNIKVAVRPPTRLLPNFCSHYNALAYSLIYRVAILGVHTKSIYLAVPLQVSYPSHELLPNGSVAEDERSPDPIGESLTSDEACCVSVVSSFDVDHVSSTIYPSPPNTIFGTSLTTLARTDSSQL